MGDRPNPTNGRSAHHYHGGKAISLNDLSMRQIEQVQQELFESGIGKRQMRHRVLEELGIPVLLAGPTPSSRWFLEDREDTFPKLINQERGDLCLGDHTDDELANELFLYGNMSDHEKHRAIMSGKCSSIAYLTAGKERIRWLSRHLEASLANEKKLQARIKELEEQFGVDVGDDHSSVELQS